MVSLFQVPSRCQASLWNTGPPGEPTGAAWWEEGTEGVGQGGTLEQGYIRRCNLLSSDTFSVPACYYDAGWFTEPTPFFTGGLTSDEAKGALDEAMGDVMDVLSDMPPATGEGGGRD